MNEIERRSLPYSSGRLEIRAAHGGKRQKLTGTAAVFDSLSQDLGGFVETLERNAFAEALRGSDIRALFNHSPDHILGRESAATLEVWESRAGLEFEIDLPDTPIGKSVLEGVKRGDITGNSFSFRLAKDGDSWDHSGKIPVRTIKANGIAEIRDVGPVTYEAYLDTKVSARSLEQARRLLTTRSWTVGQARAWLKSIEDEDYEAECRRLGITH